MWTSCLDWWTQGRLRRASSSDKVPNKVLKACPVQTSAVFTTTSLTLAQIIIPPCLKSSIINPDSRKASDSLTDYRQTCCSNIHNVTVLWRAGIKSHQSLSSTGSWPTSLCLQSEQIHRGCHFESSPLRLESSNESKNVRMLYVDYNSTLTPSCHRAWSRSWLSFVFPLLPKTAPQSIPLIPLLNLLMSPH